MRWCGAVIVGLVGCASTQRTPGEARCGPDSHPASDYLIGQPAFCPARPVAGARCTVVTEPSSRSSCVYLAPERGPCEFDTCSCLVEGPTAGTWQCDPGME